MRQATLYPSLSFDDEAKPVVRTQLLKWIGNKQRFAPAIIRYFPVSFGTYIEPFLGSGAVLAALAPRRAVGSDICSPLIQIWQLVATDPNRLVNAYRVRWERFARQRGSTYAAIRNRFNRAPNAEDLVFLSRSCYGGVIRFRRDGHMSTPLGAHTPIHPEAFRSRVTLWAERVSGATFECADFEAVMRRAKRGDLVYCDPPYVDTQAILYGAQAFTHERLFAAIGAAKDRGVLVALSIDGHKKSGTRDCRVLVPKGLFATERDIHCGRSMLKRFQMAGRTLQAEEVSDRLLLTWKVPR